MPTPFHLAVLALAVAAAPALAQPAGPLAPEVAERVQIELREMSAADQRIRSMASAGTFSPCEADRVRARLDSLYEADGFEAYVGAKRTVEAEAEARLTPAEHERLAAMQLAVDDANIARLREIVEAHGWPSPERVGGETEPFLFLLHTAPDTLDAMLPLLRGEVDAGRMPAERFASAVDKSRMIRRQPQLYGTADVFNPTTRTVGPPHIGSIAVTNAARAEIGLAPLTDYVEADR